MTDPNVSLYEQERRDKRQKIRDLGFDPYGGRTEGIQPLAAIKAMYTPEMGHDTGPVVKTAGRIMLKRDMGKLTFMTLRDESGDLQVALDKKRLGEKEWELNSLLDLGDQVVVEGPLGTTRKGEITIWSTAITMASKAMLPPPAKWEGLSDVELRYRQRYVDLWANPEVMKTLKLRCQIVGEIRNFMAGRGFIEVETPMMQPLAGGAAARPFVTHHNALDIPLYLRIAPELYLKRLLVGGFTKVFEMNRNFRNEGISPRHNPEFTMMEAYEAFGSWQTMAELIESLVCDLAQKFFGTLKIEHKNADGTVRRTINLEGDLSKPAGERWRRVRLVDLVEERTGWKFDGRKIQEAAPQMWGALVDSAAAKTEEDFNALLAKLPPAWTKDRATYTREQFRGAVQPKVANLSAHEQLVQVYEKFIEPTLIDPTYVTHIPSVIIPLARESKEFPGFADVYELAINGQEISPGYSELNDPEIQAEHFAHQVGDEAEKQKTDDDFLTALKYGMPPAGGMGLGIDRLIMMLTGAESIRDVILFPLMKPQE
ncbi:MAG: lysine--tRNA ligase [Tepidisphaeraceae bacterium]